MPTYDALAPYLGMRPEEEQMMSAMTPEQHAQILENLKKVQEMKDQAVQATQPVPPQVDYQMPFDDAEYRQLKDMLGAKTAEALNQQQSGIASLEENLRQAKATPRGIDFSALASYFDSIVPGSKLAQGYQAPESEADRQKRIFALEQAIQGARAGLTQAEIQNLKTQLNTSVYNKALQSQGRQARFSEAQLYKKEKDIGTDLEKSIYTPWNDTNQQFQILDENLGSGETQKVQGTLGIFARAISGEKGVLTDKDVSRVLPRGFEGDVKKFVAYFNENPSERLNPEYTKKMREMIATAKNAMRQAYSNKIKQKRNAYAARKSFVDVFGPGGSGDTLFKQAEEAIGVGVEQQVPAAPSGIMSPEEWLKQQQGGK